MAKVAEKQVVHPQLPGGLIPLEEWRLPETSVHRSVKDAIRNAWTQVTTGLSPDDEAFESLDDLPMLSRGQIERFAPDPDYGRIASLLLASVADSQGNNPVSFLVAPPFSGIRKALEVLADDDAAGVRNLIMPPENLLLSDSDASEWWDACDLSTPWVIPELASFWLRHRSGLALVRELLRRVAANEVGDGLIGCSSWCWQFWSYYLPDARFQPLTPAPMDSGKLGLWLGGLAAPASDSGVVARMADTGLWVLPSDPDALGEGNKTANFLRDLAALSRGIPGVALGIWQKALRARPEEEKLESKEQGERQSVRAHCWVAPLNKLSLPVVPSSSGRGLEFILHALLLHDGLGSDRLELVTGMKGHEVAPALNRLLRADLVEYHESDGVWRVTPLGYPAIRRQLQSDGFPVDAF
ncbi:hypothetical protein [uncultured Marinobacter sp.]|uniref:hypothetical protein n=1 Tax=uncultured Marinobacter sp. TaxID=187379 RepID=UPI0026075664|nr:hypothetical protein [uncultured Marinobacter sp.]